MVDLSRFAPVRQFAPSFRRRPESRLLNFAKRGTWTPAFAGVTITLVTALMKFSSIQRYWELLEFSPLERESARNQEDLSLKTSTGRVVERTRFSASSLIIFMYLGFWWPYAPSTIRS